MYREELTKRLAALSLQQGHIGLISVEDAVTMVELKDEEIAQLRCELEEERLGDDV